MTVGQVPAVFADVNALISSALRDILIGLHMADVIEVHWSEPVLAELERALVRTDRPPILARGD